jgi:hypothetical protein
MGPSWSTKTNCWNPGRTNPSSGTVPLVTEPPAGLSRCQSGATVTTAEQQSRNQDTNRSGQSSPFALVNTPTSCLTSSQRRVAMSFQLPVAAPCVNFHGASPNGSAFTKATISRPGFVLSPISVP